MIDVSKVRVGDKVTVEATVLETECELMRGTRYVYGLRLSFEEGCNPYYVRNSAVRTHTPAEIKVGDKVNRLAQSGWWLVTAVSGQRAWLTAGDSDVVVPVNTLTHAP